MAETENNTETKRRKTHTKKSGNILESKPVQKAVAFGMDLYSNKDKYLNQANQIYSKIYRDENKQLTIDELKHDFGLLMRLSKAIGKGEYTNIAPANIFKIAAAIAYFSLGKDIIPDDIPVAGAIDDILVGTWALSGLVDEMKKFEQWESENPKVLKHV